MKRILLLSIVCLMLAFTSTTFATEITVSDVESFKTAISGDYDFIKLGSNITIQDDDDGYGEWGPIVVNGKDKTIDFNGYSLIINEDECFRVNYMSSNSLIFDDSSINHTGGLYSVNSSYHIDPFEFYNYTSDDVRLIINGGNFYCNSYYIFGDTNHFTLEINGGDFKSLNLLFTLTSSFASDVVLNRLSFSLLNNKQYAFFRLTNNCKLDKKLISSRLGTGRFLFEVSGDTWTDYSWEYMNKSYNYPKTIVIVPESEAPEGALLPEIPNISMDSNGIISWDDFEDENFDSYDYMIGTYGGSYYDTTFDFPASLTENKKESGTYCFRVYAKDKSRNQLSRVYCFEYEYESPLIKLEPAENLRWENTMTAVWDPVANATKYTVYTYTTPSSGTYYKYYTTSNTSYDFSGDLNYGSDTTYYFSVEASAENSIDSNSERSGGKVGWFEKGVITNVKLSPSGVLTWDPYEGTTYYYIIFSTGAIKVYDGTSADFRAKAREYELTEGNDYYWNICAIKVIDEVEYEITSKIEGDRYVYKEIEQGDIDEDGRITVTDIRMLIQGYIHPEDLTEEQFALGDMDGDGRITIADIRRLIQEYVKP